MPLELLPTLDDLQIPQVEKHLEGVRVRRLLMQLEYKKAKNIKLAKERNKISARLEREVKKFGDILVKLIELEDKCRNQQSIVQLLSQELSFTEGMMDDD